MPKPFGHLLKKAAEQNWRGVLVDVKVAFLHAPVTDLDGAVEDQSASARQRINEKFIPCKVIPLI